MTNKMVLMKFENVRHHHEHIKRLCKKMQSLNHNHDEFRKTAKEIVNSYEKLFDELKDVCNAYRHFVTIDNVHVDSDSATVTLKVM